MVSQWLLDFFGPPLFGIFLGFMILMSVGIIVACINKMLGD